MNTLFAARAEVRRNFESHRGLPTGSEETSKQITHAEEVAKFLRENVVQGHAADTAGNYSEACIASLRDLNADCYTIELRIHEHTERGDNEDIKKVKGESSLAGISCRSF
jgi:complex III assembly factor LYRM7